MYVNPRVTRTGSFAFSSAIAEENKGSHQFLNWWQQPATGRLRFDLSIPDGHKKIQTHRSVSVFFGDPYGNRTHVTAVKGRCLNRLTNGPGSGDLT